MRIIGIDPGYDRFGIAVLERVDGKETLVFSTCIQTDKKASIPDRLTHIGNAFADLLETHKPAALSLEQLFFNQNVSTALKVAEARGIATYLARARGLAIYEYSPQAIKIAVTGHGKSDKKQMMAMIPRLVRGLPLKALDDEYDAVAVALTCLVSERWQ